MVDIAKMPFRVDSIFARIFAYFELYTKLRYNVCELPTQLPLVRNSSDRQQ